ncbi:unnamed protein product [Kuraishia capsulata CBS 1993]|uniref:Glycosyltransferase family 71 protein n=1 Tax=Kuraishia capsulata CBS 1993 TaxID=1382522 RepID=W6MGX9_9ASCO|nr:uncharacterized protein KUCA_T00001123001 [Kuraishia capsulata CBS 1993]CDK25156.1 unnamed protein product [Kuraishia capsulata CBS 1993]
MRHLSRRTPALLHRFKRKPIVGIFALAMVCMVVVLTLQLRSSDRRKGVIDVNPPPARKVGVRASELFSNHKTHSPARVPDSSMSTGDAAKWRMINRNPDNDEIGSRLQMAQAFYANIFQTLVQGKPAIPPLSNYGSPDRIYHAGYDGLDDGPVFTEHFLKQYLQLTPEEVESMKKSHRAVVRSLPDTYPEGLYRGNGIVYVGGGRFNWLALLSIKSLRSVGSKLPVEVFIPTLEEYEVDLCGRVFPALNARCIFMPRELGPAVSDHNSFHGYQYKSLALITSSFENVLLLDSDNIAAHAPDHVFDVDPFVSHGLVVWPDFWKRATSPFFYDIADVKLTNKRVRFGFNEFGEFRPNNVHNEGDPPLHDVEGAIPDPTTESGQLMISKKKHTKSLFLSLYYNLYGPDYFYPLFSQGSDGEGDKETFLAAAVVLKNSFYQVNKFLTAFGHFNQEREFLGSGMGQFDPVEDYRILQKRLEAKKDGRLLSLDSDEFKNQPRVLFIHSNFPKLNPWELKQNGKIVEHGERIRLYGPGMAKRIGYDFETVQWQNMKFLVCELKLQLTCFEGVSEAELCDEISQQLDFLLESVATLEE